MLDLQHLASSTKADVQVFTGDGSGATRSWLKPRGVSMVYMLALGPGGNGGSGAVGAASTAAGGGGGSSGAQVTLLIPAIFIPDALNVIVPAVGAATDTRIAVPAVTLTDNNVFLRAGVGNAGGNASGATPGTAGSATGTAAIATFPLAGMGRYSSLAGQAGLVGGTISNGNGITLPTTGLVVTGGASGAGLGGGAGGNGGSINGAGVFPTIPGGIGAEFSVSPGGNGSSGIQPVTGLSYFYGGSGGGSGAGTATGAGLVGGSGGNGSYGCGGGGGGGALTGSTQGLGGRGGPGLVIIIAW